MQRRDPDYRFRFHPEYRVAGQRGVALALRGGSAKGLAHIGVLQGIDEENLPVDAIVGTSAGSLMGSLYASGFSAAGIARIFKSRNFGLAFDDRQREAGWSLSEDEIAHATPYRLAFKNGKLDLMPGVTRSRRVRAALMPMLGRASWLAGTDFDRLRIPFRAVASDLTEGRGKVFGSGPLVDVVMASMCIPGVFEPVEIQGHQYVDGGPFENLPVQISRQEFPGLAQVGVAIGRPWDPAMKTNLARLLEASLDLSMAQTEARSEASADLVIRPEMGLASEFDFYYQVDALVAEGRKAFEDQRSALEDLIYGPNGRRQAASSLRLEAPDVPGALEWFIALAPSDGAAFRDLYRLLRRAHRNLPISGAEVRVPDTPEGQAVLVLRPAPTILRLEIDLPEDWPPEARQRIEEMLVHDSGLAPGRPFHEGAWSLAIETLLVEAVTNRVPILDVQGSGFSSDGTLRLRLREPRLDRIRSLDPGLQASIARLLSSLRHQPVRTNVLEEHLSRATSRLGMSGLKPDIKREGEALVLAVDAKKAPSIELAPHFAYESTWGPHFALDANFLNIVGTGSRFLFHGATNDLQSRLQGQWLDILGPLPSIEFGLGGSIGKQWFEEDSSSPVDKLTRSQFWGRIQSRFGADDRGLLQLDLGQMRGSVRTAEDESPKDRAEYARMAMEWDSLDAHTIPTRGTVIRTAFTRAFHADAGPAFTSGYLRIRRLWPGDRSSRRPGFDIDAEFGVQQNAPQERWYIVGGPDSLIGTPAASFLVPNFGLLRMGFPFTLATIFGTAIQGVPRIDIGQFAPDYRHMDDGIRVAGCGLVLRGVARSFYIELAGGVVRAKTTATGEVVRDHHISFLIGTRPFDLWKER